MATLLTVFSAQEERGAMGREFVQVILYGQRIPVAHGQVT
jgi:hypothetical protein